MRLSQAQFDQTDTLGPSRPGAPIYAVLVAALGIVFWLDWATESAPVQHLYYLPIILASLRIGRRAGFLSALDAAIGLYHLANPSDHHGWLPRDADIVQIVLFVAVAVVTAKLVGRCAALRINWPRRTI